MSSPFPLREAVNVPDLMQRDALVRRLKKIRAEAVQNLNDAEAWNRAHPNEAPFDTTFEREMIAWCDGERATPPVLAPATPKEDTKQ